MNCKNLLFILSFLLIALAVNAKRIKQLQIGVRYRPEDCTRRTRKGDKLLVKYKGSLYENKLEFDSNEDRFGDITPFKFILGADQVIEGWEKGLVDMCVGEKRKLVIPAKMGYGDISTGPKIPADSDLVFEVELLGIEELTENDKKLYEEKQQELKKKEQEKKEL